MIIKWYNRDSISDVDMKRAEAVAYRLSGKKAVEFPFDWENFSWGQDPWWANDAKEDSIKRRKK